MPPHTHATYHAVMKVAEGYRNVWKLRIFWLVWANLNHHTVQVAWRYRKTVGLLQSVCMCCCPAIGAWSLFRVQLDTRMWFLQVQNAFLGITQTLKGIHKFWTWIYIAVTDWNDPSWSEGVINSRRSDTHHLEEVSIGRTANPMRMVSQHLQVCMEGLCNCICM